MNPYLHEALYEIMMYWCIIITAPGLLYMLLCGLDKLRNRILIAVDRRKRRKYGFVLYSDNIPGTNGYRIRTRQEDFYVHHR
jgi:hypothetical protein